MALLFKRAIEVTVGTILIRDLRMAFTVKRSTASSPNTAEIRIWNLSPDARAALQGGSVPLLIEAGYIDNIEQLFLGDIREAPTTRDGIDAITTITSGDGEAAVRSARVNESFAAGSKLSDVFSAIAKPLALNTAKAIAALKSGEMRGAISEFSNGVVAAGSAYEQLTSLSGSAGFELSVQDGELQALVIGEASDLSVISLRHDSGLIGVPEIGENGSVKGKALLQPALLPGRSVQIVSETAGIDAYYRIESAIHTGDTHGQPWYTEIEGAPL